MLQGTEYYDGKTKRYVDFPITDILQMMGRAGRPQYDQHGKAVILVHEPKKSFYKKVELMCEVYDITNGLVFFKPKKKEKEKRNLSYLILK